MSDDMIGWDKDNPLHREIIDANNEAWIRRNIAPLQAEMDRLIASLPWWVRLYMKVARWLRR